KGELPLLRKPPAIKTRPSASKVAVGRRRGVIISPVVLKVPATGSKSSALAAPSLLPPAINTLPFRRRVALWPPPCAVILPIGLKAPGSCALEDAVSVRNTKRSASLTEVTLSDGSDFSFVGLISYPQAEHRKLASYSRAKQVANL